MNCLFLSCHAALEFYMAETFEKVGIKIPLSDMDCGNIERPTIAGVREAGDRQTFTNQKHHTRTWQPEDLKDIDFIYLMNFGNIDNVARYYSSLGKPVIIHMFGQYNIPLAKQLIDLMNEAPNVHIACYSQTEYLLYKQVSQPFPNVMDRITVIRFGLDTNLFSGWTGEIEKVYTTCNDIHNRGGGCAWDQYKKITNDLPSVLSGRNTEQPKAGGIGLVSYEELVANYKSYRAYLSMGTYPAPWVLNLMEACLTGAPVAFWDHGTGIQNEGLLSSDGSVGLYSNNVDTVKGYLNKALNDYDWAKDQGQKIRQNALRLFDQQVVANQWKEFLTKIV